jgi:hypothetical protein
MTTDIETLRADLAAAGWKFGKPIKQTDVDWYAYQRLNDAVDCRCNDKPPSICLTPYAIKIGDRVFGSIELEVVGESASARWLNLQVYSIPVKDAMKAIPECTEILRAAWNAAAAYQLQANLR